ncbi:MAG: hybrid cluster protein, partial [Deltaproteobacteria bacterium]|nr:hybrid cluster protein [Deltaproteobacteria bacterium]
MFCYQCEQTGKDGGCTNVGVCGKKPDVAALQDLLIYTLEELGFYAVEARKAGIVIDNTVNVLTIEGLFHTLTNVDFDPERLKE